MYLWWSLARGIVTMWRIYLINWYTCACLSLIVGLGGRGTLPRPITTIMIAIFSQRILFPSSGAAAAAAKWFFVDQWVMEATTTFDNAPRPFAPAFSQASPRPQYMQFCNYGGLRPVGGHGNKAARRGLPYLLCIQYGLYIQIRKQLNCTW